MKKIIILALAVGFLSSCEDVVPIDVTPGPTQLVIDGWLTDQPGPQQIKLTNSAAYFENSPAKPVLGATVTVADEKGRIFEFKDLKNNGVYVWNPASVRDTLARRGLRYGLQIKTGTEEYVAQTAFNRVPKIDSITYFSEKPAVAPQKGPKEGFRAEFWSRDPTGRGDCYWIKAFKNNKYFNRTENIAVAYDGAFSQGSASDGLIFILPIRRSINPELWAEKDTVRVELHAVPLEAYYFLQQVQQEGGNQGLFATPPANILTNVLNRDAKGRKALGFFGASSVSSFTTIIDSKKAKPKE
ncbi:MAG: DUF4249 domain-containing protein [Runella slithyformis]|nr:MAG: DUF4249 domain-containing protein [Runella slithyformis]TAF97271.1 MAG: DUF4249 domain-containing protein [Runella sp.]TAG21822.1 MAG: DUF4249 domain-containing protein [Cytophagales bacterium]TAG41014.1 MAG: DUF4249 domain-containing protein [Cytophagia bacterium]TAF29837.1 MAG: DUF4249 domain-containing protein [Runella slithyformis]